MVGRKLGQKWLAVMLAMMFSIIPATNVGATISNDVNVETENEITVQPRTMYLYKWSLSTPETVDTLNVTVETRAFAKVSSVYHAITVYKNGQLVYNDTLTSYNSIYRIDTLSFSGQVLDKFDIYVTHYTNNNGIVESAKSEKHLTFR